jgi:dipeptidyl aminopeptidase/acylaminoacyl peptidase
MKHFFYALLFFMSSLAIGQQNIGYQLPPDEILELADAPLAPSIIWDSKVEKMAFLYRNSFKTIAELSERELRLGGLRINPVTNIGSRTTYYNNIKVRNGRTAQTKDVYGLPESPRIANVSFSPDENLMAFTNTTLTGVDLYIVDIALASAKKISSSELNANMGRPYTWFKDSKSLLVKMLPKERKALIDTKTAIPTGPTISESEEGQKAQNRTYQDLLKNPNDEHNFEHLALSELHKVNIDGSSSKWKDVAMYRGVSLSPNGDYFLITSIHKPFSYLVTYSRFPTIYNLYKSDGSIVKEMLNVPLIEDLPKGFMATRTGKRSLSWRTDKPATLYWYEALDGGDPANKVEFRDELFELNAPFTGTPKSLLKTQQRLSRVIWGNDNAALAMDRWWNTRNTKAYLFSPSDTGEEAVIIWDRHYQDRYSEPGQPVTKKNEYGAYSLELYDNAIYLIGDGYSKEGKFPFVDKMDLKSKKIERLYHSTLTDKLENISDILNIKKGEFLVRLESKNEYPNYYIRNIKNRKAIVPLTHFENPFESIKDVHKEVINYKRDDGLDLTGTLYLPTDYEEGKKYPMILWAYPREYKDKASASQSTSNPNRFTYLSYGSPVYWVTRGYVVLNNAAFPIIGEGDEEPNDSFRSQLVANGKAAIDAVDDRGLIDRNKVAVGGHSYGAFMTANLLSHSNLFAAGIARSGAYNRTLTPFGFQREERSYWEAPEVYYTMSPFMHADKMKTPLLLIHGEADNNSGTYPMQSERYFNALKGLGAPVRLVMFPKESHGYRAKESVMHLLWEQDQWLEKYVKNRPDPVTDIKKDVKLKD